MSSVSLLDFAVSWTSVVCLVELWVPDNGEHRRCDVHVHEYSMDVQRAFNGFNACLHLFLLGRVCTGDFFFLPTTCAAPQRMLNLVYSHSELL